MNYSQLLVEQTDTIIKKWVAAVRADQQIESADHLSNTAIKDHLDHVLKAMATVLSESEASDINSIVKASLEHGLLRAEQGFDPSEIAREYKLLREVIFETLEKYLLSGTAVEIIRSMRLIDAVIDEAISECFYSYVKERLRELHQLQSSLTLHNEELTRLVRTNEDKLSFLAHELKSPLTSIIGYSDLFLRQQRQQKPEKQSYENLEHIERVLRNGRHLLHLINDLLEISRYEAGKMKLQLETTNLCTLIENVWEMLEPLIGNKNLQIMVNCDRAPKKVLTDSLKLRQIITNLLSNAIRYSNSGIITIKCETLHEQEWLLAVSDTGIGIAEEDLSHIFEPFFRGSLSEKSYLPESTGLGLAIVWRLVNLLQGKIDVVSEIGVGTTFTLKFPYVIGH